MNFREKIFSGRTRSTSRGGVLGDGVQTEKVDYKYSCTPVELGEKRKDYIVCVAIEIGDSGAKYKSYSIGKSFLKSLPMFAYSLKNEAVRLLPKSYSRLPLFPKSKNCHHDVTLFPKPLGRPSILSGYFKE